MKSSLLLLTLLVIIINTSVKTVSSEKILFILPIATKSHKNVVDPLIYALAERNHSVTVVSPVVPSKPRKNVRDIVPLTLDKLWKEAFDPFESRKRGRMTSMLNSSMFDFIFDACEVIYQNKEFTDLLKEDFDLIFFNGFVNNCFDGFLYRLKSPFILFTAQAAPSSVTELLGLRLPPSFVPNTLTGFSHKMTFFQRVVNLSLNGLFSILAEFLFIGRYEAMYRKHLGHDIPGSIEIGKNASALFMNSHFTLTYPRPNFPDTIEVGGMHCNSKVKPLEPNVEKFLAGKDGFILFSLGSVAKTEQVPENVRKAFLKVFSELKQKVIWKWNSGHMEGLPPNVMVSKWVPQQDLLGHPNIRAFITHGGLLSTQEATFFGVPCIGVPLFADQDLNMKTAETSGYALTIEVLDEDLEQSIRTAVNRILNEKQFAERAKELSRLYRDQSETPLERAIYWSEYIMRHKGAHHLRSAARDLNFVQYHSLDVLGFLALIAILSSYITFCITRMCLRKICGSKKQRVSFADSAKKRS